MEIQHLSEIIGAALGPAELAICSLALVRRLWRFLPYFVAYLILLVLVEGARWCAVWAAGAGSPAHSWVYWMTQPVLVLARAAALADVCRAALGPYRGVWKFARPLLMLAATFMLVFAAVRSNGSHWIFSYLIFLERELEFAVVISLLSLLVLSRYYGMALERPLNLIALGLGFYSCQIIVRDTIILMELNLQWWWFSLANSIAFAITLGVWASALWSPLPERTQPVLSNVESYEHNSRVVSGRMRELNERLMSLMRL